MSNGWISLHRQIQDHWLWEQKPFAQGQAWIDLLLLAYHEDVQRPYKGKLKTYHKGEIHCSLSFLADRWGWSRRRVRRFINLLENAQMVSARVSTGDTVISLVNWGKFQGQGTARVSTDVTTGVPTGVSTGVPQSIMINNDNNVNNGAPRSSSKRENYSERLRRENEEIEAIIRQAREEDLRDAQS